MGKRVTLSWTCWSQNEKGLILATIENFCEVSRDLRYLQIRINIFKKKLS